MTDRTEDVPEATVERARAAFGRRGHGELAALMHDSLVDEGDTAARHLLQFEHARMRIDLEVSVGATTRLTGTVHPPRALEVQLEVEDSEGAPQVDAPDGTFSLESVSHGLVRLHLTGPAETTPVHTDWFRI